MPDFSGYTARRLYATSAFASVHEAVAADGRPGRFALKVFHPPPSTDIRRWYAIEGWLLAAERQREAAKKNGSIVPILACGRCEGGAFAVMPWLERPLEPLVDTLAAKGDLLRAVAGQLLKALADWGAQYGRPHGNLRASNVFWTGAGSLAAMSVQLSDPWHLPGAKPDLLGARDLTAVGTILAQIVRRRRAAGWPIEDGPEWRALGRPGKSWLAYCNYLMNPHPAAGELTLEEARRRLQRIPRDPRPMRTASLTVAAVVVLGVGGIMGYARFCDPQGKPLALRRLAETVGNPRAFRTEIVPEWALLCRAWGSWLDDLQRNADRLVKTKDLWAPGDPLSAALANFRATAADLRPQALVPEAAGETRLGMLAEAPPEDVRRQLLRGTVAERVVEAWTRINGLQQGILKWPHWEELRRLLAVLEARGFSRAASSLRARLPPAPTATGPAPDVGTVLRLLNDLSLDDTGTLLLASRWGEISRLASAMEASGDRVQAAMPRLILAQLTDQPSVGDLADSLAAPLADLRRRRAQFLDPAVVRDRFLKESALQKRTTPVTKADLPEWEHELALFSHVPAADDPRVSPDLDGLANRMAADAADLEPEAPAGEAGGLAPLSRPDFDREFKQEQADLGALRGREIVRLDVPAVAQEMTGLAARFRALEQRLEATLALLRPDIWLRRAEQPEGKFAATRQRWAEWQRVALGGVTVGALEKDRNRFRDLRQQERTVRGWIEGLEGSEGFGGLPRPDLGALSPDTVAALGKLEASRRETAVDAVVAAAEWRGALPAVPWSAAPGGVRAPLEAHRQWLTELPALGAELEKLATLLNEGFAWSEGISDVMGLLARHPGLDALEGRPAAWLAEARRLAGLSASNDRAMLTAAAGSGSLSQRLTAWRRLGALATWPAGADDLDVEGRLANALRGLIGQDVRDEARRRDLLAELTRETRVRWNRAARNAASDGTKLAAVFQRMDRFGISPGDLDPPVAYNLALWRLKNTDWTGGTTADVRKLRDGFATAVRALPDVAARADVTAFLDKIGAIEFADQGNAKPAASPARAGWHEDPSDGGLRVTAKWSSGGRSVQLDFRLVQPEDDTPPFYLAERDIAVGEFIDLVAARADGRAVLDALPDWTRTDTLDKPWNKPMAWRPRADFSGIELNETSWIYLPDSQVKALFDNPELLRQTPALEKAAANRPDKDSPLQEIPPDAARIFAERLLGARLPRPQEWQAVMKLVGKAADTGRFRGQTFENLWHFLDAYRVGGQVVRWRPNEGVFLPLVASPGGVRQKYVDDGKVAAGTGAGDLWFSKVGEGPNDGGFVNLTGNVWIYLYDDAAKQFYVAGGSALSPPGLDVTQPLKVEAAGRIGARRVTEGFSDVGIRPAFDAPPGIRERYKLLVLVRQQPYLTL